MYSFNEREQMIIKQAFQDYLTLVEKVRSFEGTLEQLCDYLGGWNFLRCDRCVRFDCSFGVVTTTIYETETGFDVQDCFDVWDDELEDMIACEIHLKEMINISKTSRAESEMLYV